MYDPRDPTDYTGIVNCSLCGEDYEYSLDHECKEITDYD